jgi:hypothetical protein
MRVAILSDTHVPGRAAAVPDWVREELRRADHAIHAGDFDSLDTLAAVRDLAPDLTAVRGNVDPPGVDLPGTATVDLDGVAFVVTHGHGSADYEAGVASTVRANAGADAVGVSGHTHEYLDTTVDGVRLLNPGSATGARPATETSMIRAEVADGDLAVERLTPPSP